MRRWILLLCLHSILFCSAPPQGDGSRTGNVQIRGVVLEPETNRPIEGAEISLGRREPEQKILKNGGWNLDVSNKLTTDASGAFVFSLKEPGEYRVQARKSGYGEVAGDSPNYAEVKLTADEPAATVKLFLGGFGTLTGRVFSDDTGKAVAGLHVRAVRAAKRPFSGFESDGVDGKTGPDGEFAITRVPPGDYAVEILPQMGVEKRVVTEFAEKDLKATDLDYQRSYWPGGPERDTAMPVRVVSGATVDIGSLRAKKVPYYRVHARVPVAGCGAGDTVQVGEAVIDPKAGSFVFTPPLAHTPCGKDLLLAGYAPGTYRLLLDIDGRSHDNADTASVPFTITDENITIDAPLLPGITVDGVVVPEQGARAPDFAKLTVMMLATDMQGSPEDDMPTPDGHGRFRICCLRPLAHTILVSGLSPTWYVKEVRYNGNPLPEAIVPLDEPAMGHALTVIVDDKVAAISGEVVSNDDPVSRPFVVAVKWPMKDFDELEVIGRTEGDSSGRFQITGLPPGEYRALAVSSRHELRSLSGPALHDALAGGIKVELGPGASQNITVELSSITQP